jgi:hypothetical protein
MDTIKPVPVITHHPKAPDANIEKLRALSGIVEMQGPVPMPALWDDEDAASATERARD